MSSILSNASPPVLPTVLSLEEVAVILRVSPASASAVIRSGDLRSVRIGNVHRVTLTALNEFLERGQKEVLRSVINALDHEAPSEDGGGQPYSTTH